MSSQVNNQTSEHGLPKSKPKEKRPIKVCSEDLARAALQMRQNNVDLILKSARADLTCFDDLDFIRILGKNDDATIFFQSNGIKNGSHQILRPKSIHWPNNYDNMVEQLSSLDAHLINSDFRDKPIDWLLKTKLASVPNCPRCKAPMSVNYQDIFVRWLCDRTEVCQMFSAPIQRPSFFHGFETVAIDKLLFSLYFWSAGTPCEDLVNFINIELEHLEIIWRRIQNVCLIMNRKLNWTVKNESKFNNFEPIDLVVVKVNNAYIACAKHPRSNLVKFGLEIPNVTRKTLIDITQSWFDDGAVIRICDSRFLELKQRGKFTLIKKSRQEMITQNGCFDKDSALAYLLSQLTSIFKDFDSTSYSSENLKLIFAELEWRERYGTNVYDAFTNLISQAVECGNASNWLTEPTKPTESEQIPDCIPQIVVDDPLDDQSYIWAEEYFYASLSAIDSLGNLIPSHDPSQAKMFDRPKIELFDPSQDEDGPPEPDVYFQCHFCGCLFDSVPFAFHLNQHVEQNRGNNGQTCYLTDDLIECKHCFKVLPKCDIEDHSQLFRSTLQRNLWGCRICCTKLFSRQSYLEHMRMYHFEHEMPYSCPTCPFRCSFQRDIFAHFQHSHRSQMVVMCPLCLRSFTVNEPKLMTQEKLKELSKIVYNHLSKHCAVSKTFKCKSCCLCFLSKNSLLRHTKLNHNPLRIDTMARGFKLLPYKVFKKEEEFCVRALQHELFVLNKRPNLYIFDEDGNDNKLADENMARMKKKKKQKLSDVAECLADKHDEQDVNNGPVDTVVRGVPEIVDSYLEGGEPKFVVKNKPLPGPSGSSVDVEECSKTKSKRPLRCPSSPPLTSEWLFENMKKLSATVTTCSVAVNESLADESETQNPSNVASPEIASLHEIVSSSNKPLICCECKHTITANHYVEAIPCEPCKFLSHCPRAVLRHKKKYHSSAIVYKRTIEELGERISRLDQQQHQDEHQKQPAQEGQQQQQEQQLVACSSSQPVCQNGTRYSKQVDEFLTPPIESMQAEQTASTNGVTSQHETLETVNQHDYVKQNGHHKSAIEEAAAINSARIGQETNDQVPANGKQSQHQMLQQLNNKHQAQQKLTIYLNTNKININNNSTNTNNNHDVLCVTIDSDDDENFCDAVNKQ